MGAESPPNPPLTPEQEEIADLLLEKCEPLRAYADHVVEMEGVSGTLRYGLGRCHHHFQELTPEELTIEIMKRFEL